jgi:2,4-dienoyl-CoA reductase-like NADH-dependent reductase (Old Yellow Enzyme family)
MPHLFSELHLRDVTLPNRVGVSPMCQYSCLNGFASDWHFVHLGSRAVGGAGLVLTEAAAVVPEGRISPQDLGAWSEAHFEPLARIARFITEQGAVPGIQLAHAGRKASTHRPWSGSGKIDPADGGWTPLAPSPLPFSNNYPVPREMTGPDIKAVEKAFATAAERAVHAGFRIIELHAAHGYLFHEFLSPLSNQRTDHYGGTFENRTRFLRDTVTAVRKVLPDGCPLFVRTSAVEWAPGGWDIEQSVKLAGQLKSLGVDLIDCSSGGNVEHAAIPVGAGYQLPFADRIRRQADIASAAVGMITGAAQADQMVRNNQTDLVLLARELLRDPYWPLHAARELGYLSPWPAQYLRAAPKDTPARDLAGEADG